MASNLPDLSELYRVLSPDGVDTILSIVANARQHGRDAVDDVLAYYPWADGFLQECVNGTFEQAVAFLTETAKEECAERGMPALAFAAPLVIGGFRPQLLRIYSALQDEMDKPRPELLTGRQGPGVGSRG